MSDLTQDQVLQAAQIVAMTDAALTARIAYLRALETDDEDALSGSGYLELHALEDEQTKRRPVCGLCQRRGALAPGRTICASCAHFPLD